MITTRVQRLALHNHFLLRSQANLYFVGGARLLQPFTE